MGACFSKKVALTSHAQARKASQPREHAPLAYVERVTYPGSQGTTSKEELRQERRFPGEGAQSSVGTRKISRIIHNETAVRKGDQKLWRGVNRVLPMASVGSAGAADAAPTVTGEEETGRRECEKASEVSGDPKLAVRSKESEKKEGSILKQEESSTQTSSPLRRRRLSLSQSAKAKEDDGKERGQTIIAVNSGDAPHILGPRDEDTAENGPHKEEGGKTRERAAVDADEQRKRQEQVDVLEEHAKRETADDQQGVEGGKEEGDSSTGEETTSLGNLQRRRLSLSQSAEVVSPSVDETRGHTSVQVDKKEEKGNAGRGQKTGGDKKGDRSVSQKNTGTRVKSRGHGQPSGRRLSVAGLSSEGHPQTNFEDKRVEKHGEAAQESLAHFGIGICCKKGFKPESPNQDDFFIIKVDKWSLYGVFDGHGPAGHDVSNYVQRELPARLLYGDIPFLQTPLRALQQSFRQVHKELEQQTELDSPGCMDCSMSGTTATVVLHIHPEKKLYIAHVGDSRAVLAQWDTPAAGDTSKGNKCSRLVALDLTADHKPTNDIERQRIIRTGGQIRRLEGDVPHRVFLKNRLFPGLAMSRAIGDTLATQAGVIPDPDVKEFQLVEGRDEFLLICSDGVWEFISSQEAVEIVEPFGRGGVQDACEVLARESWRRWIEEEHTVVDDITALIIYLS